MKSGLSSTDAEPLETSKSNTSRGRPANSSALTTVLAVARDFDAYPPPAGWCPFRKRHLAFDVLDVLDILDEAIQPVGVLATVQCVVESRRLHTVYVVT